MRGGGPGPNIGTSLGLRGKNGNPVVLYTFIFGGENHTCIFLDTVPLLPLLSERLTVRVALETPPCPLGLQCDTRGLQEVLPVSWPTRDHGPSW